MDSYFSWLGLMALAIVLCYTPYISKVNKLERKMAKLQAGIRKSKGESEMSKLIEDLVGKKCRLKVDSSWDLVGKGVLPCDIIAVDEDWVKLTYTDRKQVEHTILIRIDDINGAEIEEK